MTVEQRRLVGAAGAVVAILALILVLVSTRGGDDEERLAVERPSTTTSTEASDPAAEPIAETTDTTIALLPVTTGVPVPNATEAPPPTAPPTATPAAPRAASGSPAAVTAAGTLVDGSGATLNRPADTSSTRPVDKAKGCRSANDAGWAIADCGALRSSGTVLLWVVETRAKGTRVLVLKEQTAGRWSTVLSAADDAGTAWSDVGVRGEDLSGDGQPELVFGFRQRTADKSLSVDVVDAGAAVVVHRDLARGVVQTAVGSLTTWSAAGDGYDQVTIRSVAGVWRATAPQRVDRSAAPASSV